MLYGYCILYYSRLVQTYVCTYGVRIHVQRATMLSVHQLQHFVAQAKRELPSFVLFSCLFYCLLFEFLALISFPHCSFFSLARLFMVWPPSLPSLSARERPRAHAHTVLFVVFSFSGRVIVADAIDVTWFCMLLMMTACARRNSTPN